ncbi:reverse transcriptase domain-containing protein [Luteibacter sp. 3190]|uniref:reverse transcriptase domain-containing protein n=1 Tax=Luteibacter sp. 3190 TaxID=2817736 RepID=UPI002861215E|nr:reverse transcriptase domain-containing protein [Luteibacter sp. 3190]MDR6936005.1 hypothetical protein [Luteibacter sp. 3190]
MAQKWRDRFEVKPGRWVFVPTRESADRGIQIKALIGGQWKAPNFFYHLRHGGHVAAVRAHVENRYFFRADIDDFFGRVGRSRITRCLKTWFSFADAREMADISVVRHPVHGSHILPYGFVQSPILASVALDMSRLGACLRSLAKHKPLKVSVYVDDIIISSNDLELLNTAADAVLRRGEQALFPIGALKREGPCEAITAFNIELAQHSLNISEQRMKVFRDRYLSSDDESVRAGILGYIGAVNPSQELLTH